jgi:hypothetical protein
MWIALEKKWRKHPHISKAKTININQPPQKKSDGHFKDLISIDG